MIWYYYSSFLNKKMFISYSSYILSSNLTIIANMCWRFKEKELVVSPTPDGEWVSEWVRECVGPKNWPNLGLSLFLGLSCLQIIREATQVYIYIYKFYIYIYTIVIDCFLYLYMIVEYTVYTYHICVCLVWYY